MHNVGREAADKASFYSPQLDGLRFIAALLVFFHHAPSVPLLDPLRSYGWIGVDLFLAISAFLLTRLLCLEWQQTGRIGLKDFFIRRALRIWPLFFCYASAMCVWTLIHGEVATRTILAWWLSFLSFSNNLLSALQGYSPVSYTEHLWTIALEEQAYVILPLMLIAYLTAAVRQKVVALAGLGMIFMLILMRASFVVAEAPHPFIWVLPLRSDPFILGAVAAIVTQNRTISHAPVLLLAGLLAMASVAFFPPVQIQGSFHIVGYTIVALGATAVVVALQVTGLFSDILSLAPLRYLGKISYGIYIYHLLCLALATQIVGELGLEGRWLVGISIWSVGFVLTLLVAASSYQWLEKPFLKIKSRYTKVSSRPV